MQYKLAFLFALLFVCSQAAILNETDSTALYAIDAQRLDTLIERLKATNVTEHKLYHIMSACGSFAFTCKQLYTILDQVPTQKSTLDGMHITKNNVIDPKNYSVFSSWFGSNYENRQNVSNLYSSMTPCKVQGPAPEKFPVPALPYKDQWKQADLDNLVKSINKIYDSEEKLRVAKNLLSSSANLLSSDQAVFLYDSFTSVADMLSLTGILKERIVGLSCDQVISLLNRFFFDDIKLQALEAFKVDILDVENKLDILNSFRQPSSQALASKILAQVKPKNFLFSHPAGNVLFIIDVSTSMDTNFTFSNGQKMSRLDFVKTEMFKALNGLEETSQFNILSYAYGIDIWKGYGLHKATKDNIASAINFTNHLIAYGGTNIHSPLQLAWTFSGVNTIYLLTDGFPNEGVSDTSKIVADVRTWYAKTPIQVNSIAMLMGTNQYSEDKSASKKLMSAIAEATSGNYRVLDADK